MLTQSQACNTQACPVDCAVSAWSAWGTCSATCGGGTQTQTRTVVTPSSNGGAACPALTQSQACNTQACSSGYYIAVTNELNYSWTVRSSASYSVPTGFSFISYWTFDPTKLGPGLSLSNNNTTLAGTINSTAISKLSISDKVMVSVSVNPNGSNVADRIFIGICKSDYPLNGQLGTQNSAAFSDYGVFYMNNGGAFGSGDRFNGTSIVDLAIDNVNKMMWIRVNGGMWNKSNTADPGTNIGGKSYSALT
jgi:hypothetical protein